MWTMSALIVTSPTRRCRSDRASSSGGARVTVNKLGDLSSSSCLDSLTPLSVLSQQQRLGEPKLLRVDITHTVHGPAAGQDVHAHAQRGHRISYLRWWVQWHGDENEQGGCPLAAAGRTAARPSSPEPPHQHERPTLTHSVSRLHRCHGRVASSSHPGPVVNGRSTRGRTLGAAHLDRLGSPNDSTPPSQPPLHDAAAATPHARHRQAGRAPASGTHHRTCMLCKCPGLELKR